MANLAALVTNSDVLSKISKGKTVVSDVKKYKSQYKNLKSKQQKLKADLKASGTKSAKIDTKLKAERVKKLLGNISKSILPIISMYITDKLSKCMENNAEMEELVEQTNAVIDAANTKEEILNSKVLRDKALNILNSQQNNISDINSYINTLRKFATIFTVIVNIISLLPIPTSVPPGIGVPISMIMKFVKTLQQASDIITGVNVVLSIVSPIFQRAIDDLEDLKGQLHDLNTAFEDSIVNNLNPEELALYIAQVKNDAKTNLGTYKGYKFVLKEENNIKFVVDGNKRHYAVAIDPNGTIVANSDYSFTLKPDVLVEQLKIKVNQLKTIN